MTSERRYTEEETREIFERATKAQREGVPLLTEADLLALLS